MKLLVDADACPVKNEVYRVAQRFGLRVILVANKPFRHPEEEWIEFAEVDATFDAADHWIVEHLQPGDVVITTDIQLAGRVIKAGGAAVPPNGRPLTVTNIGEALASRELMARLREGGDITGGPPPFTKADRSRFLQRLDDVIRRLQRGEEIVR